MPRRRAPLFCGIEHRGDCGGAACVGGHREERLAYRQTVVAQAAGGELAVSDDAERWQRVQELCDLALERAEQDRGHFLFDACGGDAELRREVDSLLAHAAHANDFLGASTMKAVAQVILGHEMMGDGPPPLIGRQVGAYNVAEYIGEGGIGAVYR